MQKYCRKNAFQYKIDWLEKKSIKIFKVFKMEKIKILNIYAIEIFLILLNIHPVSYCIFFSFFVGILNVLKNPRLLTELSIRSFESELIA